VDILVAEKPEMDPTIYALLLLVATFHFTYAVFLGIRFILVIISLEKDLLRLDTAIKRAEQLLKEKLTPNEYHQLTTKSYLQVKSPHYPKRTYVIPRYKGLVRIFEDGEQIMRLCVGLDERDNIPDADIVLMHKLMIERAEEEYLQIANTF